MRSSAHAAIWIAVSATSLGLHVAAMGGLSRPGGDGFGGKRRKPPTLVEMTVAAPKPPPSVAEAAPAKAPRVARAVRASNPVAAATSAPAQAPQVAETAADFTGTTLTNDTPGAGWASATGNGRAMSGPIGKAGALVTGRNREGAAPAADDVVGLGDLGRPPEAPNLADALERLYPETARKQGLAGTARMRLRVLPSGAVAELALMTESGAGFGEACRQSLRGSHWSPPLDRGGQAVSTYVQYTCRFEVR
jgi:outer membrane biosynthesis protein TonB